MQSWTLLSPQKLNKQTQTSLSTHQIGPCAVRPTNKAYPYVSSQPCLYFEVPDSEADQMESFLFISCPAGLGLVAGCWSVMGCGLQQRYAIIKGVQGGM